MPKYSFWEPGCSSCEYRKGTISQYCHGFKKRKNPKRFTSRDPKYKAPKWCPKRLSATVVRVYRIQTIPEYVLSRESLVMRYAGETDYAFPSTANYALVFEYHSGISPKEFYEASKTEDWQSIYGFELQLGDVVEVDSGLKAYSFLYTGWEGFKPAFFDSTRIRGVTA